jgi:hypothetical protein
VTDYRYIRRSAALFGALALQLLFGLGFVRAFRVQKHSAVPAEVAVIQASVVIRRAPDLRGTAAGAVPSVPLPIAPPPPPSSLDASLPHLTLPALIRSPVDWSAAALLAASGEADTLKLAEQRRRVTGDIAWIDPRTSTAAVPQRFPWSHQPLTSWFDFDARHLTTTISLGKHCSLSFFLILPAFGCILGHIDPSQ